MRTDTEDINQIIDYIKINLRYKIGHECLLGVPVMEKELIYNKNIYPNQLSYGK